MNYCKHAIVPAKKDTLPHSNNCIHPGDAVPPPGAHPVCLMFFYQLAEMYSPVNLASGRIYGPLTDV